MTNSLNRLRNVVENATKPAWVYWPCQRSFCGCFTIRSGASIIGWFNFVFNSLYVGMMVFALAKKKDSLSQHIKTLTSYRFSTTEAEGSTQAYEDLTKTTNEELSRKSKMDLNSRFIFFFIALAFSMSIGNHPCFALDYWESCECEARFAASTVLIYNTTNKCQYFSNLYPQKSCMCHIGKILFEIIPMMYKSLAIPGFMLVVNVLWLTSVESKSIFLLRFMGFIFMISIPVQLILQFYFQVYANRKFIENDLKALHFSVWIVYACYALLNFYSLPLLHKYIKLRTRECSQGIEQGLLTSERRPQNNQALNVYLEDAFAIDSDTESDRICYTITNNRTIDADPDTNNLVGYDYNELYQVDDGKSSS